MGGSWLGGTESITLPHAGSKYHTSSHLLLHYPCPCISVSHIRFVEGEGGLGGGWYGGSTSCHFLSKHVSHPVYVAVIAW